MDHRVASRLRLGARITLVDYLAVIFARRRLVAETEARLGHGFVAFPTVPIAAPPIAPLEQDETLVDYLAVIFARRRLVAETEARLGHGFVAFPTVPIAAPPIAPLEQDETLF